jgi:hypothetical protein
MAQVTEVRAKFVFCVQAEAAAEAKLRGPHAFALERLLGIFWELRAAQGGGIPSAAAERADLQSADVLMQISSLVSLRFLSLARAFSTAAHPSCRPKGPCMHASLHAGWDMPWCPCRLLVIMQDAYPHLG